MAEMKSRLAGCLLGTALGDALGLPVEGMSAAAIGRRFGPIDRFRLFGRTGFVSDDTEHSALVAEALAQHPDDSAAAAAAFRRSLVGWFLRLPFGIGMATIRASLRACLGLRPSGVRSGGNGAAMRSAIVGVFFAGDPGKIGPFAAAFAEVTHTDPGAIEGAVFVALLAAECARGEVAPRLELFDRARRDVQHEGLAAKLADARSLGVDGAAIQTAAERLGTTGWVLHTVPFAAFCFLRFTDTPLRSLGDAIGAGGDTDSIAAILGGWLGALHGEEGLPADLLARLHDGPFGPSHLRALADCLAARQQGTALTVPGFSGLAALIRNLALYPVVLAHGFRRLLPF
jgi:ADP-ribosylglycohydrolase